MLEMLLVIIQGVAAGIAPLLTISTEFQFFPPNHSVARAEYEYPCVPYELTGKDKVGFFSGFMAISAVLDDVWRIAYPYAAMY